MKKNAQQNDTVKALLDAVSPEKIESPNIPVAVAVQEAHELERTARDAWAALEGVGAKREWLDAIPGLVTHLENEEHAWSKTRYSGRTYAERALTEKAEWTRSELLAAAVYALGTDENATARIARIREGEGFADLVQDLGELHALWAEQTPAFEAIGFDASVGEGAKEIAVELSSIRATAVSAKALDDSKVERDRAWTALNGVVDHLRGAGLYAFRNDPDRDRLAAFRSRYAVQAARRSRKNRARVAGSVTVPTANATSPSNPTVPTC